MSTGPTTIQTRIEQALAFGQSLDWLYARYRRRDVDAAVAHLDAAVARDPWMSGRREARRLLAAGVHPRAARILAARVARQAAEQEEAS